MASIAKRQRHEVLVDKCLQAVDYVQAYWCLLVFTPTKGFSNFKELQRIMGATGLRGSNDH